MTETKTEYIIYSRSALNSFLSNLSLFALFVGLIGLGWVIESRVMEVVGAIIGMLAMVAKSGAVHKTSVCTTAEAAYARLDEVTGGRPGKGEER